MPIFYNTYILFLEIIDENYKEAESTYQLILITSIRDNISQKELILLKSTKRIISINSD